MAADVALTFLYKFSTLFIATFIVEVPAAKYCHYGFDFGKFDSLNNQSCTPDLAHLFGTDDTGYYSDGNSNVDGNFEDSHRCFIFLYHAPHKVFYDPEKISANRVFGCDFQNLCEDKELDKVLFGEVVNGTRGQLFCCDSENCNKGDRLSHLSLEKRVCYHGLSNRSEVQYEKITCSHPEAMCAKLSIYLTEGSVENYFCDNDMMCRGQMSSGSFRSCHASVVDNTTQKLCCCDTSLCFEPQSTSLEDAEKNMNYSVPDWSDSGTVVAQPAIRKLDSLMLVILAAVLVFVTGVGGGISIVVTCKRHRRPRPDPDVIMQYERLSGSDPDAEDAVVL